MARTDTRLTIGILSKRAGVKVETIRYYERAGLMPVPIRTTGGHRVYDNEQLRRLTFIRRGRELGFSLEELQALIGLVDGGYTCGEVRDIALVHLNDIRQKIADLRRLERTLKTTAAKCAGGATPECPIIDSLFNSSTDRQG